MDGLLHNRPRIKQRQAMHNQAQAARPKKTQSQDSPIALFFSYAHSDEKLRDELAKHLSVLERQGFIKAWHDRNITGGTEWKGQIDTHLDTARIILLLISANFLASDYCYDIELKRAMERHETKEARVIPILLCKCAWQGAPFGKLQALPQNGQAVTSSGRTATKHSQILLRA